MEGELGKKVSQKPQKFYAGVFPDCKGLSGKNWNYNISTDFSVNADMEEEYILSINEGKKVSFVSKSRCQPNSSKYIEFSFNADKEEEYILSINDREKSKFCQQK